MSKRVAHLSDLQPDKTNANKGTQRGRGMVEASLREVGAGRSIVVDKDGRVIAGNKTLEAWADVGGEIEVVRTDGKKLVVVQREDLDLSDDTGPARKLAYYDNRSGEVGLEWDIEQLLADLNAGVDLSGLFRQDELDELLGNLADDEGGQAAEGGAQETARATLAERFLIPPFSVLDARQGYWQERKRAWIALGIQSELGRGENTLDMSATMAGITDEAERAACSTQRRESPRHGGGKDMAMHDSANFPTPLARKRSYDRKGKA